MSIDNVQHQFGFHSAKGDQMYRFDRLRRGGIVLAELIKEVVPTSGEQTLAIRKVEEAVMWAVKGISVNE